MDSFYYYGLTSILPWLSTVYPKKYAHGFVVLCFVVVMQSFIMNSHEVFIHIHQGCFAGTGAIVRLPQCQWSKPDGYGKISQCITTTKHSKAKTVCIFLGIYCSCIHYVMWDEITYPKFSGCNIWEWLSNFIFHFTVHMITYPFRGSTEIWWLLQLLIILKTIVIMTNQQICIQNCVGDMFNCVCIVLLC